MKVVNALTLSLARLRCEISLKGCSWLELASPWAAGQPVLAAPVGGTQSYAGAELSAR